ncbi:MAG: hypothetical protein N3A60_12325, partial [Thermanaerothrix sp.]|nr:hypothetical protein [Thermanaerothrix sp.]
MQHKHLLITMIVGLFFLISCSFVGSEDGSINVSGANASAATAVSPRTETVEPTPSFMPTPSSTHTLIPVSYTHLT